MEPVWTIAGRTVRLTVRPDTNDWNVCQSIIAEDEYGFDKIKPLTGTAVDVGAHIGAATVALLELNPDLRVIAIEPVPENVELLRKNTAPYGDRVEIIEGGAGKGPQTVAYHWRGSETADIHRFIANQNFAEGDPDHDVLTVPGISLSELVAKYGPLSFIKIDCEGCEDGFLDDPAIDQVERVHGEYHTGAKVELRTEKPPRAAEKPAAPRKPRRKAAAKGGLA